MPGGRSRADVAEFLTSKHGAPVSDLEPLSGGHWSSAWGYRTDDGRELVVRFSELDFEIERAAMAFATDELPVPEVLEVGTGYAISVRHRGRFLEHIRPDEAERARPMVDRLLDALRAATPVRDAGSWRAWLVAALEDEPSRTTHGWRRRLADLPDAERTFVAADTRIRELVGEVPERRELVHGDLLHGNVLVDDDATRVTAVFSWKCSTWGDHVYDLAWCTFWSAWHPGIAALELHERLADDEDARRRHHVYELQIGASHLGWYAWTGEEDELRRCAERTAALLG